MAWPFTPLTTYVASTTPAIKASDLNDFQQAMVDAYNVGHFVPPQAAIYKPQQVFKDRSGNPRSLVDHNGYPMGRSSIFQEDWWFSFADLIANAVPIPADAGSSLWQAIFSNVTNGFIKQWPVAPSSSYPSPYVLLKADDTNTRYSRLITYRPQITWTNDMSLVFETEFGMSAIGANGANFKIGLVNNGALATDALWFERDGAGGGTWFANSADSTTLTATDTTVSPIAAAAFPLERLRIEFHGSASPFGTATALFFINGTLVVTKTTNMPTAGATVGLFAQATASSSVAQPTGYLGPMRCVWNRQLTEDAL